MASSSKNFVIDETSVSQQIISDGVFTHSYSQFFDRVVEYLNYQSAFLAKQQVEQKTECL